MAAAPPPPHLPHPHLLSSPCSQCGALADVECYCRQPITLFPSANGGPAFWAQATLIYPLTRVDKDLHQELFYPQWDGQEEALVNLLGVLAKCLSHTSLNASTTMLGATRLSLPYYPFEFPFTRACMPLDRTKVKAENARLQQSGSLSHRRYLWCGRKHGAAGTLLPDYLNVCLGYYEPTAATAQEDATTPSNPRRASQTRQGAGQSGLRNRCACMITGHRILCWARQGLPPVDRPYATHKCHNKYCLNPLHLEWGNAMTNSPYNQ